MNDRGLERQIVAGLKDCIAVHGPITEEWVHSAMKRIYGNIAGYAKVETLERLAIREEKRVLRILKRKVDRMRKCIEDLLDKLEALGHPVRKGKKHDREVEMLYQELGGEG